MALFGAGIIVPLFWLTIALLVFERWRLRGKGFALVLTEFRLKSTAESEELVHLRARPGGLLGAIMAALGLHCETALTVTSKEFTLDRVGLSGFVAEYAPISRVASSKCWYYRAISFLFVAFLLCALGMFAFLLALNSSGDDYARQQVFGALGPGLLGLAVVASIFYLIYYFSKRVVLSIETYGGKAVGLSYKRSVVNGFRVDLPQAIEAVVLLNEAIRRKANDPVPRNAELTMV